MAALSLLTVQQGISLGAEETMIIQPVTCKLIKKSTECHLAGILEFQVYKEADSGQNSG
jgi:hypothetical protein